jgi:hypothetical protein
MSHKTAEEASQETLQRVIRIETRLLQLGDHVGANLRTKQRIDVEPTSCGVVVYVDSMDVSFSRIMAEVKDSPLFQGKFEHGTVLTVRIRMGDRRNFNELGTINVPA